MILVIDAYNVLKAEKKAAVITELERRQFVNELSVYASYKGHTVIVIFDGGGYPFPFKTTMSRGQVIYSGFSMTADDYIRRYLQEHKHEDLFLISSDRELIRKARQCNIDQIGSHEFYQKMRLEMQERMHAPNEQDHFRKTTQRADPDLDALMIEGSGDVKKNADIYGHSKGSRVAMSNKHSKDERRKMRKWDKL